MKPFLIIPFLFLQFVVIAQNRNINSSGASGKGGNYTWAQSSKATASAGVYNPAGQLVRTLFSGVSNSAGTHTEYWDGLLDDSTNASAAHYTIKVLTNNVSPVWEGAIIGNTGDSVTGASKYRSYDIPYGVCFVGDAAFWALNYAEGSPAHFYSSISHPEGGKTFYGKLGMNNNAAICTDGNNVYMAMLDIANPNASFVWAVNAKTVNPSVFPNGQPVSTSYGGSYSSVIAYENVTHSTISSVAVQKTGNYLFISRPGIRELQVVNKTTGAVIQKLTVNNINQLAVDASDNLWAVHGGDTIEKYTLTGNGTLNRTGITITSVSTIGAIAVSPDNSTVAVCDMDNQVVKGFNTSSGTLSWTLGSPGGYLTDATVTNTKFYWKDVTGYHPTFIQYLPTGGIYLGDGQNRRTLIFDNKRMFIGQIGWAGASYTSGCDVNNPARAFDGFREYAINYTKSLAARNGSWTLTKNWGAQYNPSMYDAAATTAGAVTLSNSHTYCLMRGKNNMTLHNYIVELVNGGVMRNTSVTVGLFSVLTPDSHVLSTSPSGSGNIVNEQAISFDGSNNPVLGIPLQIGFAPDNNPAPQKIAATTNGVVFYNISAANIYNNSDFHIGVIKTGSSAWQTRTARGTSRSYSGPFPLDGWFDNGNTVNLGLNGAGGTVLTSGNFIFASYHGEFWKQSQTNKWNIYDAATGLFINQFGVITPDFSPGSVANAAQEGNVISGSIVTVNGKTYLYHNGESNGFHRWRIDGLNTVSVQTATYPSSQSIAPLDGIDLMAGLTRYSTLQNGNGWHRDTTDYNSGSNYFSAGVGYRSYNVFSEPDLSINYDEQSVVRTHYVSRDLGNNIGVSSWKLRGDLLLNPATYNEAHGYQGQYIQVLDNAGKSIANLDISQVPLGNLLGNNSIIVSNVFSLLTICNYYQPFEINYKASVITFQYAGYSATSSTTADPGAIMNNPTTLRFYFFTKNPVGGLNRQITIKDFRFKKGN